MREYFVVLILAIVAMAILTPFASDFPDGLERVFETFGIEGRESPWTPLMPDYTLPVVDNPYFSTVLAGILGILLVSGVAFVIGRMIVKPDKQ